MNRGQVLDRLQDQGFVESSSTVDRQAVRSWAEVETDVCVAKVDKAEKVGRVADPETASSHTGHWL